jgi:hypothetical protein
MAKSTRLETVSSRGSNSHSSSTMFQQRIRMFQQRKVVSQQRKTMGQLNRSCGSDGDRRTQSLWLEYGFGGSRASIRRSLVYFAQVYDAWQSCRCRGGRTGVAIALLNKIRRKREVGVEDAQTRFGESRCAPKPNIASIRTRHEPLCTVLSRLIST